MKRTEPVEPPPYYPEATPWAAGIAVMVFLAAMTATGVYAFGMALAQVHWVLTVVVNAVAVGGVAPTAWRWRYAAVTRWVLAGVGAGLLAGWLLLLVAAVTA